MAKKKTMTVAKFIDPHNCGSAVLGLITMPYIRTNKDGRKHVTFDGGLRLTDCGRSVEWDIIKYDSSHDQSCFNVEKINRAIACLVKLRDAMVTSNEKIPDLYAQCKAHNAKLPKKKGKKPAKFTDVLDGL